MKTILQISAVIVLGLIFTSFGEQNFADKCDDENNCLELNGDFFSVSSKLNNDSTYKSYSVSSNSESFFIPTPGLIDYKACESLESGNVIYIDYPVDSIQVDFDMGKIQLKDGKIPEKLRLRLIVDTEYCWTDRIEAIFISDKSKSYGLGVIKDLNYVLSEKKDEIPNYILIRRIQFFCPNINDKSLDSSFLFEIE